MAGGAETLPVAPSREGLLAPWPLALLPDHPLLLVTDLYGQCFRREDPPGLLVQGEDGFLEVSAPGVFDVGEKDAAAAVDIEFQPGLDLLFDSGHPAPITF